MSERPTPPDSLPQYLVNPLDRQDDETLRDAREYIDALLEYRAQEIDEEALPDDAEPVDDTNGEKGTVVKEKVTCGDGSCRCMSGGEKHGPYLYRYYREGGTMKSEYIGKV